MDVEIHEVNEVDGFEGAVLSIYLHRCVKP